MAALEAARLGTEVLLFDQNEAVGRKLLATGNGRCNISNVNATPDAYVCTDRGFLDAIKTACRDYIMTRFLLNSAYS